MKKIFYLTTITLIFISCNSNIDTKALQLRKDSFAALQAYQDSADQSKKLIVATSNILTEKKLINDFRIKKDEFQDVSFYTYKSIDKSLMPNKTCVFAYFNSEGTLFLVSNYYNDDWIFHTSITVLINGDKLQSSEVPSYSKMSKTENAGGSIWENVTYNDDAKLIQWMAENSDKTISIRFNGRQYYHDITMSAQDKKVIKETWDLYHAKFPAQ